MLMKLTCIRENGVGNYPDQIDNEYLKTRT